MSKAGIFVGVFVSTAIIIGGVSVVTGFSPLSVSLNVIASPFKKDSPPNVVIASDQAPSGQVLAATDPTFLQFNVPAIFKQALTAAVLTVEGESTFKGLVSYENTATFLQDVFIQGQLTLNQNLTGKNVDIDLKSGKVIASNLVYSVTAGSGISVSGTQDLTITNDDKGSDQKIFKTIKVGGETITADSNTDQLTLSAGTGMSLSRSGDEVTFSATNLSGWYQPSSSIVALITGTNYVGIGTTAPTNRLEIDSGTNGLSGLTFTKLTSSSAAGVGGGKVLSVDSGGKVILVADEVGEGGGGGGATPSAEAVLPTSATGGTIYYNGSTWVSSTNLFHDGGKVGISTDNPQARLHVYTNSGSSTGLIVQGYTGQSANLQEWQDADGEVLAYVDENGVYNGTINVTGGTMAGTLNPGFTAGSVVFQGASGLTQDNSNFFWDDTNNTFGIGTSSPTARLHVTGTYGANDAFTVNQTGAGNIFTASASGTTKLTLANNGNITATGTLTGLTGLTSSGTITFSGLSDGFVQSTGGVLSTASTLGASSITADALDFSEFKDSMTLDASTTISIGNSYGLTYSSDLAANRSSALVTITQPFSSSYGNSSNLLKIENLDNSSTGIPVAISNTGTGTALQVASTGGNGVQITTSGTLTALNLSGAVDLTSGNGITFGSGLATGTVMTGDLIHASFNKSLTGSSTYTESGSYIDFSRGLFTSNTVTANITGDMVKLASTCTQTAGTCTDSSNILSLAQNYASATGDVVEITNAGSGDSIELLGAGTRSINSTSGNLTLKTTTSGNLILNSASTIELQDNTNVTGNLDATGTLAVDGAITFSTFSTNGGILYTNSSGVLAQSAAGSSGECLQANGSGGLTWSTCGSGSNWRLSNGTLSPLNDTLDLLVGGSASSSAKFAVLNVNTTTPVASVSGTGTVGATYMTSAGTIQTTRNQTLTIGGDTTGNITLSPRNGSGTVTTNGAHTVSGAFTANGTFTLGDNGDTGSVNTSDWDISTTGAMTGISGITNDGGYTQTGTTANTFTGATAFTANSATAMTVTDGSQTYLTIDTTTDAADTLFNLTGGSTSTISTGNIFALTGDTITTGKVLNMSADALTTGYGLYLESTSTALTTGGLGYMYWNPGSATTATGDLLTLEIGSNANIGNIFNIKDSGSSLFSVSESKITSGLPHEFVAGDVGFGYDVILTNQTASYIKTNASLTIEAGELYESNNLTFKTYNSGNILFENATSGVFGQITGAGLFGIGTTSPTSKLHISSKVTGKALVALNETGNQDVMVASVSGTTKFRIANTGGVFVSLPGTGTSNALCHTDASDTADEEIVDCTNTPAADYMEFYPVEKGIVTGEIVVVGEKEVTTHDGDTIRQLVKSSREYQHNVIGVISDPAMAGNFNSIGYNIKSADNPMPVALNGRVPVKVSQSSQPIDAGDLVTTSHEAGKATKATKMGPVIGKALTNWRPGQDTVMIFVSNSFYYGDLTAQGNLTTPTSSTTLAGSVLGTTDDADTPADASRTDEVKALLEKQALTEIRVEAMTNKISSLESQLASLSAQVASASASPLPLTVSSFEPTTIASISAAFNLADLIASASAGVDSELVYLGTTRLGRTTISDSLNVGLLWFEPTQASIESLIPIAIQPNSRAAINFQGNKVSIDINGNVTVAQGVIIGNDQFRGAEPLPAGEKTLRVTKDWGVAPTSITANASYNAFVWVSNITATGFTLNVSETSLKDQLLYWTAIW